MQKILITGGSGLVGTLLSELLLEEGYEVRHLSRSKKQKRSIKVFQWDLHNGFLEEEALKEVDYIIHLAGASIAEQRWSIARKRIIMDSRIKSAKLLHQYLAKGDHAVKAFISASAVGYYGDRGSELLTETSEPSDCFLGKTVQWWEEAGTQMQELGLRTVFLRTGIVLSEEGGALPKTALPVKFGLQSYFGSGQQYFPWIHIEDLARLFLQAIQSESMIGAYNAVAPETITNKELVAGIAKALDKKRSFSISAPESVLRFTMGELADVLLNSQKVSADKVLATGFKYDYPTVKKALQDIYA